MLVGMNMRSNGAPAPRARQVDYRKIGRKILSADRMMTVMERAGRVGKKTTLRKRSLRSILSRIVWTKRMGVMMAGVGVVAIMAIIGVRFYQHQQAMAAAKAEQVRFEAEKRERASALACRQQKLADRSELFGKVTYDELYDGNACDNLPQ